MKKLIVILLIVLIPIISGCTSQQDMFIYDWKQCQCVAVFNKGYYNVYGTAKEGDTNYEYYYKSIRIKSDNDKYYIELVDWRKNETVIYECEKCLCIVVVNWGNGANELSSWN